jgi:hypothetical protein
MQFQRKQLSRCHLQSMTLEHRLLGDAEEVEDPMNGIQNDPVDSYNYTSPTIVYIILRIFYQCTNRIM